MKLRRFLALLLTVLLCLSVMACGSEAPRSPYAMQWQLEAPQLAEKNGELHFYFMSGEGLEASPGNQRGQTEKWGDCCLVVFPDGKTMLIDSAFATYTDVLMENLERLGIEKLDYVMLSHPHEDHYEGFLADGGVLETIPVEQGYHNGYSASMPEQFAPYGVALQTMLTGDTLTIGGVKLTCLSPDQKQLDKGTSSDPTTNGNNASLVVRMDFGEFSALFTGDIYSGEEKRLVKEYEDTGLLDVDLLKLPHHGDTTSSTEAFADATSPKLGVATGAVPINTTIYLRYIRYADTVLHDLQDGYVHVWTDGTELHWETSRSREGTVYDKYDKAAAQNKDG